MGKFRVFRESFKFALDIFEYCDAEPNFLCASKDVSLVAYMNQFGGTDDAGEDEDEDFDMDEIF